MKLNKFASFFFQNLNLGTLFKIFANFILIFFLIFVEILFLSNFALLLDLDFTLNQSILEIFTIIQKNLFFFKNLSQTEFLLFMLIILLLLRNFLTLFHTYFQWKVIFDYAVFNSNKLLNGYINKSYLDFIKKDSSVYVKNIIRDIEYVFVGIFGLLISIIADTIYVLSICIFSLNFFELNINYKILIILGVFIFFINLLLSYSKNLGKIRAEKEQDAFKYIGDILLIFKHLKLKKNYQFIFQKFNNTFKTFFNTRAKHGVVNLIPKFLLEILFLLLFYLIFLDQNLDIKDFLIKLSPFILAILRLVPIFAKIAGQISQIIYNAKSIHFIKDDLVLGSNLKLKKNIKKINLIESIQLSKINFSYLRKNSNKFKIIDHFDYKFRKGKIYGIFGPSGQGKSTLLDIISGLIKPNSGKLYVNKKQINYDEISKSINIGYAFQNNVILNENVLSNISLKFDHDQKEINKIKSYLNLFNLNKFNNKKYLVNNSMSNIKNISGGEIQRFNIIRALYSNPDLILLDEPSSALDILNEKKVFNYLRKIKKEKIIIVTTHKQNLKKYFDKIIYFDQL